ncbi:hypothetical protein SBP18_04705 [Rhodoferax ferrireducens]|uniref:hypothetical protein n=1 Tax=Rhodoferax ferrireducens TaxID=192843 RepID=UPI00298E78DC|nr:hypothetical protein [Rhodoferax ferrireducens]WPC67816.1 hypothetical protein SBP18_04705 [Rhodoferax ferrireducens]
MTIERRIERTMRNENEMKPFTSRMQPGRKLIVNVLTAFLVGLWHPQVLAQTPWSEKYTERQTFGKQAFAKDNNIWVYTPKFAETFGMPPEHMQELKGFEAAAFRVQFMGYSTCGYGGKAENCAPEKRCLTDVYFDESKTPLPWANEQQADWLGIYNSSWFVRTPGDAPISPKTPSNVIGNIVISGQATLRPFADPKTRKEANVFASYTNPRSDEMSYSNVGIYGYERSVVAGLTILTLSYRCGPRNSTKRDTSFRIESRDEIYSPTLARFHEFFLPEAFEQRIDEYTKASKKDDREFYKSITNLK